MWVLPDILCVQNKFISNCSEEQTDCVSGRGSQWNKTRTNKGPRWRHWNQHDDNIQHQFRYRKPCCGKTCSSDMFTIKQKLILISHINVKICTFVQSLLPITKQTSTSTPTPELCLWWRRLTGRNWTAVKSLSTSRYYRLFSASGRKWRKLEHH